MKPDIGELQKFLTALQPESNLDTVWCWQVVRKPVPQPFGLPPISKTFHFHASVRDALPQLAIENANGAAIFVTINETDGNGRKVENITRVRAVFVDLDGAPVLPLFKQMPPHMVVQTSVGKYHAYWRIEDCPLELFSPLQKALIAKFDGDKSVHDLSRVMRVPGFHHCKRDPFPVRLAHSDLVCKKSAYSVQQVKNWLKPAKPIKFKPAPMPEHLAEEVTRVLPTLVKMGLHCEDKAGGKHIITCPWAHHHTQPGNIAAYFEPSDKNAWAGGFRCLHAHCADRGAKQLQKFVSLYLGERHDG